MAEKKGGRPKIAYDSKLGEQIQSMAQYGLPQDKIAIIAGLSLLTLRKLYAKELEIGNATANLAVGKKLFERCMAGDIAALIFWAKTRMGWREKESDNKAEVNSPGGKRVLAYIQEIYGITSDSLSLPEKVVDGQEPFQDRNVRQANGQDLHNNA